MTNSAATSERDSSFLEAIPEATSESLRNVRSSIMWKVTGVMIILRVEPIGIDAWVRMVAVATSIIVAIEIHKLIRRGDRQANAARHDGVDTGADARQL